MGRRLTWDYLTKTAARPAASWTPLQVAQFHVFNPNGLYAAKRASDARVRAAVAAGKCATGALIAHGSLNHYYTDCLMQQVQKCKRTELLVILRGVKRDIATATKFLETL